VIIEKIEVQVNPFRDTIEEIMKKDDKKKQEEKDKVKIQSLRWTKPTEMKEGQSGESTSVVGKYLNFDDLQKKVEDQRKSLIKGVGTSGMSSTVFVPSKQGRKNFDFSKW
jgi:hypothetical protein